VSEAVNLLPVDGVEVTIVTDNSIDILAAPTDIARRPGWRWDWNEVDQLRAEHGYSLAVTVHRDGNRDRFLYDAGLTRDSTIHNMDVLEIDPKELRAIVLSHGHADHHGGLEGLFARVGRSMPIVLHPHAWRERKVVFPPVTRSACRHRVIRIWTARDGTWWRRSGPHCCSMSRCW
jgi:7,8-dihydropterin-6-yl-methyl-4-(beta-D-ribofuranosyl)aminobenzene 5'-phosphate synthase